MNEALNTKLRTLGDIGLQFMADAKQVVLASPYPIERFLQINAADVTLCSMTGELGAYGLSEGVSALYEHVFLPTVGLCIEATKDLLEQGLAITAEEGVDPIGFSAAAYVLPDEQLTSYGRQQTAVLFAGEILDRVRILPDDVLFNALLPSHGTGEGAAVVQLVRPQDQAMHPVVQCERYILDLLTQDVGQTCQSLLTREETDRVMTSRRSWSFLARQGKADGPYRAERKYNELAAKHGLKL